MTMRNTVLTALAFSALIACGLVCLPAQSAEVYCNNPQCQLVARLVGPIEKGDYQKVAAFIPAHQPAVVYLDSPGGDVDEALKIGRLFRAQLIETDIWFRNDNRAICASACALIWFGGIERNSVVGLHRPRFTDPMFASLPPAKAAEVYRQVLERINIYLREMEVPASIIEQMTNTSSSAVTWIDADKDVSLQRPPSIAEWEDAACGPEVDVRDPAHMKRAHCISLLVAHHAHRPSHWDDGPQSNSK
jgi:hypothetical protein